MGVLCTSCGCGRWVSSVLCSPVVWCSSSVAVSVDECDVPVSPNSAAAKQTSLELMPGVTVGIDGVVSSSFSDTTSEHLGGNSPPCGEVSPPLV